MGQRFLEHKNRCVLGWKMNLCWHICPGERLRDLMSCHMWRNNEILVKTLWKLKLYCKSNTKTEPFSSKKMMLKVEEAAGSLHPLCVIGTACPVLCIWMCIPCQHMDSLWFIGQYRYLCKENSFLSFIISLLGQWLMILFLVQSKRYSQKSLDLATMERINTYF